MQHNRDITLREFLNANVERNANNESGGTEKTWNLVDWTNELCGEAGELANIAKKVRRARRRVMARRQIPRSSKPGMTSQQRLLT